MATTRVLSINLSCLDKFDDKQYFAKLLISRFEILRFVGAPDDVNSALWATGATGASINGSLSIYMQIMIYLPSIAGSSVMSLATALHNGLNKTGRVCWPLCWPSAAVGHYLNTMVTFHKLHHWPLRSGRAARAVSFGNANSTRRPALLLVAIIIACDAPVLMQIMIAIDEITWSSGASLWMD